MHIVDCPVALSWRPNPTPEANPADPMDTLSAWAIVTRWGNAMLLLPLAAWIVATLCFDGERQAAWRWTWSFGAAVLLVLATKIAFLGWGIGSRVLDFTGISGHSTLAASVLPMMAWWLTEAGSSSLRRAAIGGAVVLAVVVALSRVFLSTHSTSEVVAGLALGSMAAWSAIPRVGHARVHTSLRWVAAIVLLGIATVSRVGDSDEAHGVVARLALALSGRATVYTRDML